MTEKTDMDLTTEQSLESLWHYLNQKDAWGLSAHDLRDKFTELFPSIAQKAIQAQDHYGNRTNMIHFSRQLKPQPPNDSTPYWWGIGTLSFKDNECKTVWEQEIPEAGSYFQLPETYKWLDVPRYFFHGCSVEFDPHWGWILNFYMAHEEAAKIWGILFKDHPEVKSEYDKLKGQCFSSKEKATK